MVATGGVQQNCGRAKRFSHSLVAAFQARGIHSVAGKKLRGATGIGDFFYPCFAAFGTSTGRGDFGAGLSHGLGASATKCPGCANHHGNFIVQIE